MLYIQFDIKDQEKYTVFRKIYDVLYEIKPKEESRPLEFWKETIPEYVKTFLQGFYNLENALSNLVRDSFKATVNYLEFGLEADFTGLTMVDATTARIDFEALGYPYGGMDRLLIFLKAFNCIPNEVFNGFSVCQLSWDTLYDYSATELPEKTATYLKR
ncbi:MAG: hypothetical protein ACI9Y7_001312 [Dokdonia sp.]|jgi:hypothetical protein